MLTDDLTILDKNQALSIGPHRHRLADGTNLNAVAIAVKGDQGTGGDPGFALLVTVKGARNAQQMPALLPERFTNG